MSSFQVAEPSPSRHESQMRLDTCTFSIRIHVSVVICHNTPSYSPPLYIYIYSHSWKHMPSGGCGEANVRPQIWCLDSPWVGIDPMDIYLNLV